MSTLPEHLRGDGPCQDCGTADNICWFTESPVWNFVVGGPEASQDPGGLLCIPCFVKRAAAAGLEPTGWRLLPEWRWTTRAADHHARLAAGTETVHLIRNDNGVATSCCYRTPRELPHADGHRMTADPDAVTCGIVAAGTEEG